VNDYETALAALRDAADGKTHQTYISIRKYLTALPAEQERVRGLEAEAALWRAVVATETEDEGERLASAYQAGTSTLTSEQRRSGCLQCLTSSKVGLLAVRRAVIARATTDAALDAHDEVMKPPPFVPGTYMVSGDSMGAARRARARAGILAAHAAKAEELDHKAEARKERWLERNEELCRERDALRARVATLEGELTEARGQLERQHELSAVSDKMLLLAKDISVAQSAELEALRTKARNYDELGADFDKMALALAEQTSEVQALRRVAEAARQFADATSIRPDRQELYEALAALPSDDRIGIAVYQKEMWCRNCGHPLVLSNYRIADGCPCNSKRGVNHGLVPTLTCTCVKCDPEQTGSTRHAIPGVDACRCHAIIGTDPTRHFKECPKRAEYPKASTEPCAACGGTGRAVALLPWDDEDQALAEGRNPSAEPPLAPVPRGHCGRCDKCEALISGGHHPDCGERDPKFWPVSHCPGCGAPYETGDAFRSLVAKAGKPPHSMMAAATGPLGVAPADEDPQRIEIGRIPPGVTVSGPRVAPADDDPCPHAGYALPSQWEQWLGRENERRKAETAAMAERVQAIWELLRQTMNRLDGLDHPKTGALDRLTALEAPAPFALPVWCSDAALEAMRAGSTTSPGQACELLAALVDVVTKLAAGRGVK